MQPVTHNQQFMLVILFKRALNFNKCTWSDLFYGHIHF